MFITTKAFVSSLIILLKDLRFERVCGGGDVQIFIITDTD